jgi:light-regulated signal transduction histidine kinase (bacteriophytochrome)
VIKVEWNPFKIENDSKFSESSMVKDGLESIKSRLDFLTNERNTSFLRPFFIELIERVKNSLGSIKNYTQLSRGKFSDRQFGEYYYRAVSEDIEKMEMVLNSLIDYMKLHTPIRKMNTVHNIIEELSKKHHVKLEEKGIKLLKRFEKDLPETVVPDEQLRYVLSSVLQYAMVVTPPNWNIALSTKSLLLEKETGEAGGLFKRDGKQIEISVVFAVHQKLTELASGTATTHKEEAPDILLRFVRELVLRNHGTMKIGVDEKRTKSLISLRVPVERRKVVYYQSVN